MRTINLKLGQLRIAQGRTQAEVAKYLGITHQSVSKWEKGQSMPDIELLPKLAAYFQVSVDQLLGLVPLPQEVYRARNTGTAEHWDKHSDFLEVTRKGMWNRDYLAFLIRSVWKITSPVRVVDFGCGTGFLGKLLLPLLPSGSTYTGIDASSELLDKAKRTFAGTMHEVAFVQAKAEDLAIDGQYDLAICQAFLRHLPTSKDTLQRMIRSVKPGGLVIGVEVHRPMEEAGLFLSGIDGDQHNKTRFLQPLWQTESKREGRQYDMGLRLPTYMKQLGLSDIEVRVNDRVTFVDGASDGKDDQAHKRALLALKGWDCPSGREGAEKTIALLESRGVARREAVAFVQCNDRVRAYLQEEGVSIVRTTGLVISSGRKSI